MNIDSYLHIAAFQGRPIEGNIDVAVQKAVEISKLADMQNIEILCLPECFLTGYFEKESEARKHSIDLKDTMFAKILDCFKGIKTTVILGLNESEGNKLFNTVVVIEDGRCLGKYRKSYTYAPYDYFHCGSEYPIFEKNGVKFGIIICYDSLFFEPSKIYGLKGAKLLFCPSFNRVKKSNDFLAVMHRKSHFISRSFENNCWFVVSDIVLD